MNTVNIAQFMLLLVYVAGVWSWEKVQEPANQVLGKDKECLKDNSLEKNKYMIDDSCEKNNLMKGECDTPLKTLNKYTAHDGVPCDTLDNDGDDSDLVMLGQEVTESSEQDDTATSSEEHHHQAPETGTLRTLDNSIDVTEEKHNGEFELISKPDDILSDSGVQDEEQPSGRDEEIADDPQEATTDVPVIGEDVEKGSEGEEIDSEQESVPLREILLKLKPEGLTDDDDEQSSDYSVMEPNLGDDVEVEEEALVSSGSPEKQEQNLYINDTKGTTDVNGANPAGGSKKAVCLEINTTDSVADVEIINATTLLKLLQVDPNVTSRSSTGPCYLIYFFSPYCPFSVVGSPYVNALARSLPNIPIYGLDSIEHHSVNARYGVMGTPTLLLFHNGNGVGRYNASEYSVSQLMSFVRHYTDQELTNINVTSSDFRATLPSQIADVRPYALWAAWIFLLSFASWLFLTSDLCARLTEAILNNWREAEAQNDHQD